MCLQANALQEWEKSSAQQGEEDGGEEEYDPEDPLDLSRPQEAGQAADDFAIAPSTGPRDQAPPLPACHGRAPKMPGLRQEVRARGHSSASRPMITSMHVYHLRLGELAGLAWDLGQCRFRTAPCGGRLPGWEPGLGLGATSKTGRASCNAHSHAPGAAWTPGT